MNDDEIEDFKKWFDMQPSQVTYTECRAFLSSYLGVTNGEAEVEMADLSEQGEIKVIQTYKASGTPRRVFMRPLDQLSESHIKEVFSGEIIEKDIEDVAKAVHDRTAHDVPDIVEFIGSLDGTITSGSAFSWRVE